MAGSTRSATSYQVTLGGTTYTQPEGDGLESIVVEDHVDMVESLTLRLSGDEGAPKWKAKIGDAIEVKMGSGARVLFKGEVIGLEPAWTVDGVTAVSIRALDNAHRLGRVDPRGFFTTVAGSGKKGDAGDGGPAAHRRGAHRASVRRGHPDGGEDRGQRGRRAA